MKRYRRWGISAAAVFLVLCAAGALFPMMFYLNDDVTMRSVLSGAYTGTPDGHAVYMKYPLAGLISLLYRVWGRIPWFSVILLGAVWLSVSLALGHFAAAAERAGEMGIRLDVCAAALCAFLFLPHAVYLHYTVVAAILGSCGLFLTAVGGEKKAVALFTLCYCVRSQVFFLLLPFLGVIYLWKFQAARWKRQLAAPALLTLCIGVCMLWNGLMYSSDQWRQYQGYNENRTRLYDYCGLLPYEEHKASYGSAGIGEGEYAILEQYALALDSGVDGGQLGAAADIYEAERNSQRDPAQYLKFCLTEYYYHTVHTDRPYSYVLICGYLIVALLLWRRRSGRRMLLLCCMAAGRSLIWIYLIWQGRFPERVSVSLYLLEIMALAGMAGSILTEGAPAPGESGRRAKKAAAGVLAGISLLLLAAGMSSMITAAGNLRERQETQREWDTLTAYCAEHGGQFYLLDVRSMVSYSGRVWEAGPGEANYLLAGGWMSGTPLLRERLGELGAGDGGELLALDKAGSTGIWYIAAPERDMDWLAEYLERRFGNIKVEQKDSILLDGKEVFRVYGAVGR